MNLDTVGYGSGSHTDSSLLNHFKLRLCYAMLCYVKLLSIERLLKVA